MRNTSNDDVDIFKVLKILLKEGFWSFNVPVNYPIVDGSLTLHLRLIIFSCLPFNDVYFNILHPLHTSVVKNCQCPQKIRGYFLRFYKFQHVKIPLEFVDGLIVEALIGADFHDINATTAYAFHHAPAALDFKTTEDIIAK